MQTECLVQFLVGVYDDNLLYVDDWRSIAARNLSSLTGFWSTLR